MAISLPRKLWTVDEYELMIEKGILDEDDNVELIKGEIVEMAPIGLRHAGCVTALQTLFHDLVGEMATVSVQNPVQLPDDSEPQPDIALLKGGWRSFMHKRPTASDVLLLVEVSDSTLAADRGVKLPLYAEAGIREVWIVNLDNDVIEAYSQPSGGKYTTAALMGRGQSLALPAGLPGQISVDEVLE